MLGQRYAQKLNLIRKDLTFSKGALLMAAGALALLLVVVATRPPRAATLAVGGADAPAMQAYAARLSGLAHEHLLREHRRERAQAAETARWNGLAEAYGQPVTPQGMRPHPNDVIGAYYAAQAIRLALETGQPDLMPACLPQHIRALLPSIGNNLWRTQIGAC